MIFLNDWAGCSLDNIKYDFEVSDEEFKGVNILFASYTYEDYNGSAFVLFYKEGKIYEVNGSHCSCYGLEGQWDPEEVSLIELKHRVTEGNFGYCDNFKKELKFLLDGVNCIEDIESRIVIYNLSH